MSMYLFYLFIIIIIVNRAVLLYCSFDAHVSSFLAHNPLSLEPMSNDLLINYSF